MQLYLIHIHQNIINEGEFANIIYHDTNEQSNNTAKNNTNIIRAFYSDLIVASAKNILSNNISNGMFNILLFIIAINKYINVYIYNPELK